MSVATYNPLYAFESKSRRKKPFSYYIESVWEFWMGNHLRWDYKCYLSSDCLGCLEGNHDKPIFFRVGAIDVLLVFTPILVELILACVSLAFSEPTFIYLAGSITLGALFAARALLASVLTLLSLPFLGVVYLAMQAKMKSPFYVFEEKNKLPAGCSRYGAVNFFNFFIGYHQSTQKTENDSYHCGVLDVLILPFLIDFIWNKLDFKGDSI